MEKRLILATVLSMVVLLAWSALVVKPQPQKMAPSPQADPGVLAKPEIASQPATPEKLPTCAPFIFSQEDYDLVFNVEQAAIQEVIFKRLDNYKLILGSGLYLNNVQSAPFNLESRSAHSLRFVQSDQNKKIIKVFTFSGYEIRLDILIYNMSNLTQDRNVQLDLGRLYFPPHDSNARYQDVTIARLDNSLHVSPLRNSTTSETKFLSLRDRYTCLIVQSETGRDTAVLQKINNQEALVRLDCGTISLSAQQQAEKKFHIYLGPQELQLIKSINPEWSAVIYYGNFDFISQMLLKLLGGLHHLVRNWGWAIVLLSIIIYFLLYPLTLKQMRSMKEMQALQPRVEELRRLYKDNQQKLNKEVLELYRAHKVNPFGGCLPLILQIPVFFALYQALMRSIVLKGAKFLWIKDLAEPDRLFVLPAKLPIIGDEINLLPLIMALGMFVQQKMSNLAASSGTAGQQKIMLVIFPVMLGLIFYHMPAGLVLYWAVNSVLMLVFQYRATHSK